MIQPRRPFIGGTETGVTRSDRVAAARRKLRGALYSLSRWVWTIYYRIWSHLLVVGGGTMAQVQGKFCPLGAPVGKVDGSVVINGQLDCSLREKQNVSFVVGSIIKYTLPSKRDTGYLPGM